MSSQYDKTMAAAEIARGVYMDHTEKAIGGLSVPQTSEDRIGSAGQTMRALEQVIRNVDDLDKVLVVLAERLQPILSAGGEVEPNRRNVGSGPSGPPSVSQVTNLLSQVAEHLEILRARVQYIGARLEL